MGMRCIIGLVLFLVLYFGTCSQLDDIVAGVLQLNDPNYSRAAAMSVGAGVVKKYHAVVAVVVGLVTLLGCALPSLLSGRSEAEAWSRYDRDVERGGAPRIRTLAIVL